MNKYSKKSKMSNNNHETITSQIYHVQVIETDASIRCGLKPFTIYRLIIGSNQLQLKADHNNKDDDRLNVLFEWPYKYVRRYGYTSNSISFEAGSKCQTGEGLFIFRNKKSKILYNQITNNIDRIKRQKKSSSMIADDDLIVVVNDDDIILKPASIFLFFWNNSLEINYKSYRFHSEKKIQN